MDKIYSDFLTLLSCAIHGETPVISGDIEFQKIYRLATEHMIAPVLYESVCLCEQFKSDDEALRQSWRKQTIATCMMQLKNDTELSKIYSHLEENDVHPLLVKGLVCRSLYNTPSARLSGDEDLLVNPDEWEKCENALSEYGLISDESDGAVVTWSGKGGIRLEVHRTLFPESSAAYGHLNEAFTSVFGESVNDVFCDIKVNTLSPTHHFLYLLCHSIKHFLGSGFGVRQLCDISLFAEKHSDSIDWDEVFTWMKKWGYDVLTLNLLNIGIKYLGLPKECVKCPTYDESLIDPEPLLMDLFDSGVYGKSSGSRVHSSRITLNAVEGKTNGKSVLKTVFPPKESLLKDYPKLEKSSAYLPVAWAKRIAKYGAESLKSKDNSPAQSVQIGNKRVELMKKYRIINK